MKTISDALASHLAQECTTLAKLWQITRTDGVSFYFTSFDTPIVFNGNTYSPSAGFDNTAYSSKSDLSTDNLEVTGIFDDDSITLQDLRAGKFDYASVNIFYVNWTDLTQGALTEMTGYLGECISSPQGWFQTELRGLTQLLQQNILEEYCPVCRADLGDLRCTVPIDPPLWAPSTAYNTVSNQVNTGAWVKAVVNGDGNYTQYGNVIFKCTTAGTSGATQPTFNTTVGGTTTDGSVVWTTVAAWTRDGAIATVIDEWDVTVTFTSEDSRDVDNWYQYGVLVWDTGQNQGTSIEIKNWVQGSATVTFNLNTGYPVSVGDKFHISPGCDKTRPTCMAKFSNLLNMRAEPDLPMDDYAFYYPNASN